MAPNCLTQSESREDPPSLPPRLPQVPDSELPGAERRLDIETREAAHSLRGASRQSQLPPTKPNSRPPRDLAILWETTRRSRRPIGAQIERCPPAKSPSTSSEVEFDRRESKTRFP